MTKIIAGLTGLVATVTLVGASAFALFSDNVTVTNASINVGNANVEIAVDSNGPWLNSLNFESLGPSNPFPLTGLYPGFSKEGIFYLRNVSTAQIELDLSARLTAAPSGSWEDLKDKISVEFYRSGDDSSGVKTLAEWNAVEPTSWNIRLPDSDDAYEIKAKVTVDPTAGNEIAGKTLNTSWEITATQVALP